MMTFKQFSEAARQSFKQHNIKLKKATVAGSPLYHGSHEGVDFHLWSNTHHTDTSRASSKEAQAAGYQSYASNRKDKVWNWRTADNRIHDGYGSKTQALNHIADLAKRKEGPWKVTL